MSIKENHIDEYMHKWSVLNMFRVTTEMNGLFASKGNGADLEKIPIRQPSTPVITEICSDDVDRNQFGTK